MSASTTNSMLEAYARQEPWKRDHDQAQICFDVEELLSWGVKCFQVLNENESRLYAMAMKNDSSTVQELFAENDLSIERWLSTSTRILVQAKLLSKQFDVAGLAELEEVVEEAKARIENVQILDQCHANGESESRVIGINPDPSRYGD